MTEEEKKSSRMKKKQMLDSPAEQPFKMDDKYLLPTRAAATTTTINIKRNIIIMIITSSNSRNVFINHKIGLGSSKIFWLDGIRKVFFKEITSLKKRVAFDSITTAIISACFLKQYLVDICLLIIILKINKQHFRRMMHFDVKSKEGAVSDRMCQNES